MLKIASTTPQLKALPIPPKQKLNVIEKTDPPTQEGVRGIAFPGALSNPFLGGSVTGNGFSPQMKPPQSTSQLQFQLAQAEQARQRSASQKQLITMQIYQHLSKLFSGHETLSGQCFLSELSVTNETSDKTMQFECNSPKLFEIIKSEQQLLIEKMSALNRQAKSVQGFSVGIRTDIFEIILIQLP